MDSEKSIRLSQTNILRLLSEFNYQIFNLLKYLIGLNPDKSITIYSIKIIRVYRIGT